MPNTNDKQVCAITTEAVYLRVLKADGQWWTEWAKDGQFFRNQRPMDRAILVNEKDGIASYLDRVH
jgi:hypothetical protein